MKKKTIIVSQDDKLRQALEFLLNTEPSVLIAGSIRNFCGLLAMAKAVPLDLVFLDWDVSDIPGTDAINTLHHINPAARTIILSDPKSERAARWALATR